jgi:hypothetical protein
LQGARPYFGGLLQFLTWGPVVQEVLQGLRRGVGSDAFRATFDAVPLLSDPVPIRLFTAAADIYRWEAARNYGSVIKRLPDSRHRDRDLNAIARYTALELFECPMRES